MGHLPGPIAAAHRMKLVLHCGLHKTGSTSFQNACLEAQPTLAEHGVLYPSTWEGGQFPLQHAEVALALLSGEVDRVISWLKGLQTGPKPDVDTILISAEDLCSLFWVPRTLESFHHKAARLFDDVRYVLVLRRLGELVPSAIRQYLVHSGTCLLDPDARFDVSRYFRMVATFEDLLGPAVTTVSYATLRDSGRFCNALLDTCVPGRTAGLLTERTDNAGAGRRDPTLYLTATLRGAIALSTGTNPYALRVEEELGALLDPEALAAAFRKPDGAARATAFLDEAADAFARREITRQADALRAAYAGRAFLDFFLEDEGSGGRPDRPGSPGAELADTGPSS